MGASEATNSPDRAIFSCRRLRALRLSGHAAIRSVADPRHSAAMRRLHAGIDNTVMARWLSHVSIDTTQTRLVGAVPAEQADEWAE